MIRFATLAALAGSLAAPALAAPEAYSIDTAHTTIVASWDHLGYAPGFAMFSGVTGEIAFDPADAAASSVTISFPVTSMQTGDEARKTHFMTPDFFGAEANPTATFASTAIEVTGEKTAKITGDLTINGITKPVVLDATLNSMGEHPMEKKPWAGFAATTTVLRSDYDMAMFAPFVSDAVTVQIGVEAMKAE